MPSDSVSILDGVNTLSTDTEDLQQILKARHRPSTSSTKRTAMRMFHTFVLLNAATLQLAFIIRSEDSDVPSAFIPNMHPQRGYALSKFTTWLVREKHPGVAVSTALAAGPSQYAVSMTQLVRSSPR